MSKSRDIKRVESKTVVCPSPQISYTAAVAIIKGGCAEKRINWLSCSEQCMPMNNNVSLTCFRCLRSVLELLVECALQACEVQTPAPPSHAVYWVQPANEALEEVMSRVRILVTYCLEAKHTLSTHCVSIWL